MKVIFSSERASLGAGLHYGEIKIRLFLKTPLKDDEVETDEEGERLYNLFEDVRNEVEDHLIVLSVGSEDCIACIEE